MIKTLFAAAIVTVGMSAPVFAAEMMTCDDAHIMKAEESAKMAKGEHMEMAMKDVDMAKMAMKDGKMDDCTAALEKAMKNAM